MKYLGCVPCTKRFKLGKLEDKHPIFAVIENVFGLLRYQIKLYHRIIPNKRYDGVYVFKRAG